MNAPRSARRSAAAVVVQSLLWLWLIGLSVFVALGYQTMKAFFVKDYRYSQTGFLCKKFL